MADIDKLTLEIEDKASDSTDSIIDLMSNLKKLDITIDTSSSKISKLSLAFNGLQQSTNKSTSNLSKSMFGGATELLSTSILLDKVGRGLSTILRLSNDYIETTNLFNVVMGESTEKAWGFVQALESIGVDQEQAMRYQSSFYDIGKSLGMTAENAYTLSEQFTKLSYDYASLYNLPFEESFQKLQAAIVGTTEPIRRLGKDISIAKLEEVALNLGIEESVRNMTQAEKAELRFIAVMQQSTAAMNDMERTIDQPANALRVLRAQLTSLGRELGNLFIPALSAVLPWLIAFTKFLRGIISDIAGFFGITFSEIDFSGINSQLGQSDAYTDNLADNLDDSAKNAKKLKDYLLGIDELNVLNPDTGTVDRDTGASAGTGVGGGLGVDLSDFGYDEILKDVQSRADEILKLFEKWKTPLLAVAGILAGLWTIGKITNFVRALKGVQTSSTVLAGVQGLGGLAKSFFNLAGTGGVLGTVATAFVGLGDTILTTFGIVTGSATVAGLTGLGVVLAGVAVGAVAVHEAMEPAVEQMDEFANVSEETKEKLEPVVDTWKDLQKTMLQIDWKGVIIDEDIDYVINAASSMADAVIKELDSDYNKELEDINMLQGLRSVTAEEYQTILDNTNEYYTKMKEETQSAQEEIAAILESYRGKNVPITEEDKNRITELYNQIGENAVAAMSESAYEQEKILNKLKYNQKALTIEAGSEMVMEAKKNYDKQVQDADSWRETMLANLDKKFLEEGTMTQEEYDAQKATIEGAYNDMVSTAWQKFNEINSRVRDGLGEQASYIDEETGEIKSVWQRFWDPIIDSWNNGMDRLAGWLYTTIGGMFDWMKNRLDDIGEAWDDFWDGIDRYKKQFKWNDPGTWFSGLSLPFSMNANVDYGVGNVATPNLTAFARGGFVPANASFVPPDTNLWTAGEAGREIVGNFKGKTTVMPLEDTGFVQAMYNATREAVISAMSQTQLAGNTPLKVKVYLDSREIRSANVKQETIQSNGFIKRR